MLALDNDEFADRTPPQQQVGDRESMAGGCTSLPQAGGGRTGRERWRSSGTDAVIRLPKPTCATRKMEFVGEMAGRRKCNPADPIHRFGGPLTPLARTPDALHALVAGQVRGADAARMLMEDVDGREYRPAGEMLGSVRIFSCTVPILFLDETDQSLIEAVIKGGRTRRHAANGGICRTSRSRSACGWSSILGREADRDSHARRAQTDVLPLGAYHASPSGKAGICDRRRGTA